MSVATSRSERPAGSDDRAGTAGAPVVTLHRPAVRGEAGIVVRSDGGTTRLADLHQRDPLSLRLPQPARGDILEACLITTSGGIVGGDHLDIGVEAAAESRLRVYPQAAEKVYRSLGADSRIEVALKAGPQSWLEWLPQETILFEGARLRRRTCLEVARRGRLLAGEFLVFGRRAFGESLTAGLIHDAWRVKVGGRLVWADALHMDGHLAGPLASVAALKDVGAFASFIYVAEDAPEQLSALRDILPKDDAGCRQALTAVNGLIVGRFLGESRAVRRSYGNFWAAARQELAGLPAALPRLWHL